MTNTVPAGRSRRPRGPERAERRHREHEIRNLWRAAAAAARLAERVFSPSGTTLVVPTVTAVHLGPPVRFTVRLRPAQTWEDLVEAGPRIADTFGVPAILATELAPGWIEIELLADHVAAAEPDTAPVVALVPSDGPGEASTGEAA